MGRTSCSEVAETMAADSAKSAANFIVSGGVTLDGVSKKTL